MVGYPTITGRGYAMNVNEARGHGHHLAIAASIRVLAMEVAKIANPREPEAWFTSLSQRTFQYVDEASNPHFDERVMKVIKETTYESLRMIFDPKGFKV
jgi:hypothetical protein